jgi:hypothetical protein
LCIINIKKKKVYNKIYMGVVLMHAVYGSVANECIAVSEAAKAEPTSKQSKQASLAWGGLGQSLDRGVFVAAS